jgi:predicted  nucleic acid-binding Zn-ribbon protein
MEKVAKKQEECRASRKNRSRIPRRLTKLQTEAHGVDDLVSSHHFRIGSLDNTIKKMGFQSGSEKDNASQGAIIFHNLDPK